MELEYINNETIGPENLKKKNGSNEQFFLKRR